MEQVYHPYRICIHSCSYSSIMGCLWVSGCSLSCILGPVAIDRRGSLLWVYTWVIIFDWGIIIVNNYEDMKMYYNDYEKYVVFISQIIY